MINAETKTTATEHRSNRWTAKVEYDVTRNILRIPIEMPYEQANRIITEKIRDDLPSGFRAAAIELRIKSNQFKKHFDIGVYRWVYPGANQSEQREQFIFTFRLHKATPEFLRDGGVIPAKEVEAAGAGVRLTPRRLIELVHDARACGLFLKGQGIEVSGIYHQHRFHAVGQALGADVRRREVIDYN